MAMMTIEEAIKHCEEVAKQNRELFEKIGTIPYDEDNYNCLECAKAHEQLASWLKELKKLRERTSALDKARAEIAAYGSIWVEYGIPGYTEHDIEVIVKNVLKQAKEQVLKVIDKYRTESEDKE